MPSLKKSFFAYVLESKTRFIVFTTVSWSVVSSVVLIGRKILTGFYGSPEFVGVLFCAPVVALVWSVIFWRFIPGRDSRKI
jgi:hypothetical protein